MPIITSHHLDCGPPLVSTWPFGHDVCLYCDCYDGAPDSGHQITGRDEGERTLGERWVRAALNWNQDIEDMS